jgi:hypothetical protein
MKNKFKETPMAGLGNNAIPAGYNTPGFGMGTAISPGTSNPEAQLAADSAAITPNGIDLLNKGFSLGGAIDPLAEFEPAADNLNGLNIGGGKPTPPQNTPGFPSIASSSFKEDDIGINDEGMLVDEVDDPFIEGNPFGEDDAFQAFEDVAAIPAFENIEEDDPALAALPVDADGYIHPIVVPDEVILEPELGEIPDVALPFEEPILDIDEDDVDVAIPEDVFENDGRLEAIQVVESFHLPESQNVIVSKGDQIFILGHVQERFTPKFAECAFSRALKSLAESKWKSGASFLESDQKPRKVAIVGRSMLVEVAKDWILPGTDTLFEAHDLLQIVSAKPVREAEETNKDEEGKKEKGDAGKPEKSKKEDEVEIEKAKKEYYLAKRRWLEAKKKRSEDDDDIDDDDEDGDKNDSERPEKKKKKERAKRESAMLERQRTGGWI